MLVRNSPKTRQEQRRINTRRRVKEHRDRLSKGLAVYPVEVDAEVLYMLVLRNYLTKEELTNKAKVSRALSQMLMDPAHENNS